MLKLSKTGYGEGFAEINHTINAYSVQFSPRKANGR